MTIVTETMWNKIKILIEPQKNKLGRPQYDNRKTFEGILHVLYEGCRWRSLPEKYGQPTTIHGKFMQWCRLGIFEKMIAIARQHYEKTMEINNWYAFDTSSKKAPFASFGGKNPTDRGKRGIKHSLLVDRKGMPMYAAVAPANTHDSKLLEPIIAQLKITNQKRIIAADSAFDVKKLYKLCSDKNIALVASINPRRDKTKEKTIVLHRWVVEQAFGIFSWIRGLKTCWNKTLEANLAFLQIACSIRMFKSLGVFG